MLLTGQPTRSGERMDSGPLGGELAVAFQEPLTIIVRVEEIRNERFRRHFIEELDKSVEEAKSKGYSESEISEAKFALVVFLDEVAAESTNPLFRGWEQLQWQLYKRSDGGEEVFRRARARLDRSNSSDEADLLELYGLCILLGLKGGERARRDLSAGIIARIGEIREKLHQRNPPWSVPEESPAELRVDRWRRPLLASLLASILIAMTLFGIFNAKLNAAAEEIRGSRLLSAK